MKIFTESEATGDKGVNISCGDLVRLNDGQEPVLMPTLDNQNSCAAVFVSQSLPCARYDDCEQCTSGRRHIWIKPDQMQDYLALKLVS